MPIMQAAQFGISSVSWSLFERHQEQALKNHSQTLERLAERGGLSCCEALAIIENRRWKRMDPKAAADQLISLNAHVINERGGS